MGERWVWIGLGEDETLRCDSCMAYLHSQKVYLYLDVNDSIDEIMCAACWKKEGEKR